MTRSAHPSHLAAAALAAVAGLSAATALAASGPAPPATPPETVPVVVQDRDGSGRPAAAQVRAARALAARLVPGARVEVLRAYGPDDAAGAVARAAATPGRVVIGSGVDVRAALELVRQTWPDLRTATVPGR